MPQTFTRFRLNDAQMETLFHEAERKGLMLLMFDQDHKPFVPLYEGEFPTEAHTAMRFAGVEVVNDYTVAHDDGHGYYALFKGDRLVSLFREQYTSNEVVVLCPNYFGVNKHLWF